MRPAQIRVYRAKDGWRWHMRAPNGKLVAEGGEAYRRREGAAKAAARVVDVIRAGATVTVVETS